eukprot:2773971-Prymnesium_polylepis.1
MLYSRVASSRIWNVWPWHSGWTLGAIPNTTTTPRYSNWLGTRKSRSACSRTPLQMPSAPTSTRVTTVRRQRPPSCAARSKSTAKRPSARGAWPAYFHPHSIVASSCEATPSNSSSRKRCRGSVTFRRRSQCDALSGAATLPYAFEEKALTRLPPPSNM